MPIYDHKYGGLDYFRVYRAWGGNEFQEYVRIGEDRSAALKKAEQIESAFEQQYQDYQQVRVSKPNYHVRDDGSIRGLRRVKVERASRAAVEVLELRINVPWLDSVRRTTVSITTHGFDEAFKQAIDKVRDWYGLDETNAAVKAMRDCDAYYAVGNEISALRSVRHKAKHELETLTQGVFKGLRKLGISGT